MTMQVKNIMTRNAISVSANETILNAVQLMPRGRLTDGRGAGNWMTSTGQCAGQWTAVRRGDCLGGQRRAPVEAIARGDIAPLIFAERQSGSSSCCLDRDQGRLERVDAILITNCQRTANA